MRGERKTGRETLTPGPRAIAEPVKTGKVMYMRADVQLQTGGLIACKGNDTVSCAVKIMLLVCTLLTVAFV